MDTENTIRFSNSEELPELRDESVDLVVTSPPYPMIEMWDECFSSWDASIEQSLSEQDGNKSFERMHTKLDAVWEECARALKQGAFACINIGDATRKIGNQFKLYSNHSRITRKFIELGFDCLPLVLWRKQTNAPNKFMGSGMLPSGAYVTLEHEYILIFRKGRKRKWKESEKEKRQASAFFWEERNSWFSDVWDFKGTQQTILSPNTRKRSAAYPVELAHRIINMYSLKDDVVVDPFLGTGTTLNACMLNRRQCRGYEIDTSLADIILENAASFSKTINSFIEDRYQAHLRFMENYSVKKGPPKYTNVHHHFPVVTNQETKLKLETLQTISIEGTAIRCSYGTYDGGFRLPSIQSEKKRQGGQQAELFSV
jgi:modification methylase